MDNTKAYPDTETLALEIERFSGLSSEMISLLENIKGGINRSALELQDVQTAVEAGKRELEALCEIEKETSFLEQQIETLRQQKDTLERLIADQQSNWEEAKAKQAREKTEYEEILKTLRQKEEEEHRLAWENEQMTARQKLRDELDAMRRESAEARAEEVKELLARGTALEKREHELSQLLQELERFVSGLAARIGASGQTVSNVSGGAAFGFGQVKPAFFGSHDESKGGFNPDNALMWENADDDRAT